MIEFILKGAAIGLFTFAAYEYGLSKGLEKGGELGYQDGFTDGQEAMFDAVQKSGAVFMIKDTAEERTTRAVILNKID